MGLNKILASDIETGALSSFRKYAERFAGRYGTRETTPDWHSGKAELSKNSVDSWRPLEGLEALCGWIEACLAGTRPSGNDRASEVSRPSS